MTVSIIIPCYNYGQYLAEAIESALAQTWPADEILIIDDGSTDDSLAVARRYEGRPGVRVVAQANRGAVATFNNGVRASRGDFFLKLDADDRLAPQSLQRTAPLLEADPRAAYVYTAYRYFGARDEVMRALPYDSRRLAFRPYILGTSLTRRSAFEAAGGFSTAMASVYEDWDLYLTLAERGWTGIAVDEVLYYYRQHLSSRNSMSVRRWLAAMALLYRRHPSMRTMPLQVFLARAVLDRSKQRLQARVRLPQRNGRVEIT